MKKLAKNTKTNNVQKSNLQPEVSSKILAVIEQTSTPLVILNKQQQILFVNNSAEIFLKRKSRALLGKNIINVIPQSLAGIVSANLQQAKKTKKLTAIEVVSTKSVFPQISICPSSEGFILSITDKPYISHQEEKQYLLTAIVESSEDAIISKTLDGIITSWNQAAERMFGYKAKEAIGEHITLIVPPELYKEEEDIIKKLRLGKRIQHFETVRIGKDGNKINVSLSISPVKTSKGEIIGAANITRDINEKKEQELRKDEFISMASHELKTPITSLKLFIEIMQKSIKKYNDERLEAYVRRLGIQTNKLRELVSELLDVSRIQTGKLAFRKEEIQLDELVLDTVEALTPTTSRHRFIMTNISPVVVIADRFRVYQVLTNFIVNAIKYSPQGEEIHINLVKKGNHAVVSVKDFGIGIAKNQQTKIFDKLYQVPNSQEKSYPGLGMGLYISREIIKRHNGKIWVESKKGSGSTFFFSLPIKN